MRHSRQWKVPTARCFAARCLRIAKHHSYPVTAVYDQRLGTEGDRLGEFASAQSGGQSRKRPCHTLESAGSAIGKKPRGVPPSHVGGLVYSVQIKRHLLIQWRFCCLNGHANDFSLTCQLTQVLTQHGGGSCLPHGHGHRAAHRLECLLDAGFAAENFDHRKTETALHQARKHACLLYTSFLVLPIGIAEIEPRRAGPS